MFLCLRRSEMSLSISTVCRDRISVILKKLFPNLLCDFLTNIDWLMQSHGSIVHFDWFINLTLFTQMSGFSLIWIANPHKLKMFDGLLENKKFQEQNQCFDSIKSINWYRLANNGWVADIDLLDSMILLV